MDPLSTRAYLRSTIAKCGVNEDRLLGVETSVMKFLSEKGVCIDWYAYKSQYPRGIIEAINDAVLEATMQKP